jgi:hypothetical protein
MRSESEEEAVVGRKLSSVRGKFRQHLLVR